MCKCHFKNKETGKIERTPGTFTLSTGNKGDIFRFPHEHFKRKIVEIDFKAHETFAPPLDNYNGMDDKDVHVFHNSFKAIWGEPL